MHVLLLPEDQLGDPRWQQHPADDVSLAAAREPLERHESLAQREEDPRKQEPQPEDLAMEAEQRPEGDVRYVGPVKDLKVTVSPGIAFNMFVMQSSL